ncbi:probable methyltransferase-like protein 25 [Bombina bombina]|uniref:probable methyltransferase-like protein 25 n=1 Tax=Bombina bombina TaxID=8345 RepID=UPI00235A5429|nr:probable methyltransferase-like protein 25 [Bombina bombina]
MSAQLLNQLYGPNADQVKEAARSLMQFLQRALQISRAHTVDFYTQDVWKKLVDLSPDAVLSFVSQSHGKSYCEERGVPDMSTIFCPTTHKLISIASFVEAAQYYSLMNLGLCTPIEKILDALKSQNLVHIDHKMKTGEFMNGKKSHEVVIMSQLVECIANACEVKQVIDLGAGKGYLSSYLSMRYDLKVYGIDSSHTNTDGANKRNQKLKKYWRAYKNHAKPTSKAQESDQKKRLLPNYMCLEENTDIDILRSKSKVLSFDQLSISGSTVSEKPNDVTESIRWEQHVESYNPSHDTDKDGYSENALTFLDFLPTGAVEESPVLDSVCKDLSQQEKEQRKIENMKAKKLTNKHVYSPVTSFVTAETELHDIITDLEESIMVGLHTCGDLAPNTLRIYTSKPEIRAVCSVGCCYHLLSEEFEIPKEEKTVGAWGFPMSQYLRKNCWSIGRNARMSACLAMERVAVGQGVPSESLFYRAVLQVICKDCYGIVESDKRVGKIFTKSSSFTDYVRWSLRKLGQDDSKLSDTQIVEYYEKYKSRNNELEAFNMLKVMLAPCIEALILLDRLCYLHEQENIAWTGLVKLFDPVKSPRCYAVVSLKRL